MKRTTIVDKLGDIAAAIKQRGSANLTRLTVIKKWFEVPSRLSSFAIFIADQASRRKTKTTKEASKLIREARTLLADADVFAPKISRKAATRLHASLRTFQNEQLLARRCSATPRENHPDNWVGGLARPDLHAMAILFARDAAERGSTTNSSWALMRMRCRMRTSAFGALR
jgi:hypothetical protein